MSDKRIVLICLVLFSIPFIAELPNNLSAKSVRFHSDWELTRFQVLTDSLLPEGFNGLFAGSGECIQCHGFDTAGIASVNNLGEDINVVDDWRASMMANSAKDPFWRAKVSHEVILYPQHQEVIETKCTSCHAPLGHFEAMHSGQEFYTIVQLMTDTLAMDGVSCLACHQQSPEALGDLHSGHLNFDTNKVAFGPYISPLESPMVMASDYKPVYSTHISDAGICAGCHTLITETLDYDGNFTGTTFVEQATYHEWLNSSYEVDSVSCQTCHMEAMTRGQVLIAAGFETAPRSPFYLHELAGANIFMLQIFRDNIDALELSATAEQFDDAILATEDMLYNKSITLDLDFLDRTADTAYFELNIRNLAGHKFPSGYPSRRAFVEFAVTNQMGDTIFISGKTDDTYEVLGHNNDYEPHYDIIRAEDEVQIYEMVIADVNDEVTTVLVRGEYSVKDNRLPPDGFTSGHAVYDTVKVAGLAEADTNFNREAGMEGTGGDKLFYHVPLNQDYSALVATAKIYYQTAPPKWMEELFDEQSDEIDEFRAMFEAADRQPLLIKERSVEVDLFVSTKDVAPEIEFAKVISNLSTNGIIQVASKEKHSYEIYNLSGALIDRQSNMFGDYQIAIKNTGLYILHFINQEGDTIIEKIIYQ